jgi:hypothetical protein
LTTVSPLYQNVTSSSVVSTATLSSTSSNSLASDQSSSFAAALRKLAKQACDLTDCNQSTTVSSVTIAGKSHHIYSTSPSSGTIASNSHLNPVITERDADSRKFELLSLTPHLFDRPHSSRQEIIASRTSPCVR